MRRSPRARRATPTRWSSKVSAAGFQLKGSGWYATDFKGSGAKPAPAKARRCRRVEDGDRRADAAAKSDSKSDSDAASSPTTKTEAKTDIEQRAAPAAKTGATPAAT